MKTSRSYIVYKTLTRQSHKEYIKIDKRFKKDTPYQAFKRILSFDINFVNSLDFSILGEENFWSSEGNKILFPGNEIFFNRLYNAEMSISDTSGFELPFKSFIVSVPAGMELQGRKIPSFQVNFIDYATYNDTILKPFCDKCKIEMPHVNTQPYNPGERVLTVNYPNHEVDKTGRIRFMEMESKLPKILKAKTIEEMKEVIAPMKDKYKTLNLNDDDVALQSIILKLIASIGIYYVATDKKSVIPGMPDIKGLSVERGTEYKPMNFKFENGNLIVRSQSEHVRGWSFRQLKHEKYYKGEYKDLAPGTRIVFVDSYVAGMKAESYKIN